MMAVFFLFLLAFTTGLVCAFALAEFSYRTGQTRGVILETKQIRLRNTRVPDLSKELQYQHRII